mgnify:CR=1 FL=1
MEIKPTILIVDDDESQCTTLSHILDEKGYDTDSASTGKEAIEKAKQQSFDLALLDIKLPDMDGTILLASLKEINSDMAAVMVTGFASLETAMQALNQGASAYITKPMDIDKMLSVVGDIVERQRLKRENKRLFNEVQQELSERKRAEERIKHLNRVLNALRTINRIVTTQKDRYRLLKDVCDTLLRVPDYHSAWISLLDKKRKATLCVEAGIGTSYHAFSNQMKLGNLPHCATRAMETPEVVVVKNPSETCSQCPISTEGVNRYAMCVQLAYKKSIYGILCVSAIPTVVTDDEALSLFREVAGDIAFALHNIELEEKHKAAEEEIIHHQQEVIAMRETDRMKTDLLSNVSHELRTPLATIKGYSTMMIDYDKMLDTDEKQEYLQSIDDSTDRLIELIDHLLDMSRMEAGLLKLEKEDYNLLKLMQEIITEANLRANHHTIKSVLPIKLPNLNIDAKRIRQVIDNVINNSIKYSEAGTVIEIKAQKDNSNILISISDQGIGIPDDELNKVFDRMYRIKHKGIDRSGIGLGLSICKGLVEAHGGKIWIQSKLKEGSIVYFTLPIIKGKKESGK